MIMFMIDQGIKHFKDLGRYMTLNLLGSYSDFSKILSRAGFFPIGTLNSLHWGVDKRFIIQNFI